MSYLSTPGPSRFLPRQESTSTTLVDLINIAAALAVDREFVDIEMRNFFSFFFCFLFWFLFFSFFLFVFFLLFVCANTVLLPKLLRVCE